jgi:hypothetical protein
MLNVGVSRREKTVCQLSDGFNVDTVVTVCDGFVWIVERICVLRVVTLIGCEFLNVS